MSARDVVCKGCKDVGIANCIACLQRRFREELTQSSRRRSADDGIRHEKEGIEDDASGNQKRRQ